MVRGNLWIPRPTRLSEHFCAQYGRAEEDSDLLREELQRVLQDRSVLCSEREDLMRHTNSLLMEHELLYDKLNGQSAAGLMRSLGWLVRAWLVPALLHCCAYDSGMLQQRVQALLSAEDDLEVHWLVLTP